MSFEVSGLTYGYGSSQTILNNIDLKIPTGSTTAVIGYSGSGKSTLVYLLGLLWDGKLKGTIIYESDNGPINYGDLNPAQAAALRRSDYGFVLQSSYMLPHFSCAQNAAMPLLLGGAEPRATPQTLQALVEKVDRDGSLLKIMNHRAGHVSGGQRQRFAVVRAVVHDPSVVFADEPFSSLDEEHTALTLDLLAAWRAGQAPGQQPRARPRTLILVCHDLEIAFERADHFVFVAQGGRVIGGRAIEKTEIAGPARLKQTSGPELLKRILRTGQLPESTRDGPRAITREAVG